MSDDTTALTAAADRELAAMWATLTAYARFVPQIEAEVGRMRSILGLSQVLKDALEGPGTDPWIIAATLVTMLSERPEAPPLAVGGLE